MNQFKVGDTVWTIKKGIGKIIAGYMDETNRPFCVQWPSGLWSFPKLSNLYRIEAEMIEAKKCNTGHGWFSTVGFWPDLPDPPQPKFKRGDKVYYEGKKWDVGSVSNNSCIIVHNSGISHIIPESELRLWKEHEFTHWMRTTDGLSDIGIGLHKMSIHEIDLIIPSAYKTVYYLGKTTNGVDTFNCITNEGISIIIYGKKGDIEI